MASADGSVQVADGEALIAEAERVDDFDPSVPEPVSVEEARRASGRYRGDRGGQFSRCFVCGLDREDGLGVFAGEVAGRDVVASPWTPPQWTGDRSGQVRPELVWAVLDCPTYFAAYMREELAVAFLARMTASLVAPVPAGEEHVVIAWPIEVDGRKRLAGSAVLAADGEIRALAHVLLVEPRT